MKKSSTPQAALVEFLAEFAKFMLSSGVSLTQFHTAAQVGFLQAAMEHARLRNSRINQSALAAITGLSRPQVRSLLRELEDNGIDSQSRMEQVLDAWQSDPDFRPSNGTLESMPIRGGPRSFAALVKKYGRDVSYKALLLELLKLRYVRVHRNHVILTARGRKHFEPKELQQLSAGLAFALRRMAPGDAEVGVFTADAIYKTPSPTSRLLIRKRLIQSTKAFAADIKATGEAEASKSTSKPERISRTSILVLTIE